MTPARLFVAIAVAAGLAPPGAAAGRLELPDVALVDTAGREVRLRQDVIGTRVVALQFVFTRCGSVCPAMGAQFARVQALLQGQPYRLVSISIDPEHDTPARLAEWGARFGVGPEWLLLTGAKADIDRLQKAGGVFAAEAASHTPTLILLDGRSGRFTRVSGLAAPQAVADALARLAAGEPEAGAGAPAP